MKVANVFTKSVRDHWIGMTVASVSLGLFLFAAMAMYKGIDLSDRKSVV